MKCDKCNYEGSKNEFRYLANVQIDESITSRECPKCHTFVKCDELAEEKSQKGA
jgi:hypothetical protein